MEMEMEILFWRVCDVIKFQDDHVRMRINDPLALFARLRETRIV